MEERSVLDDAAIDARAACALGIAALDHTLPRLEVLNLLIERGDAREASRELVRT